MRRMKAARVAVLCWLLALLSCSIKPCFADISEFPIQITPEAPYKTKIKKIKNSFTINLKTKIPENTDVNPWFSLSFLSSKGKKTHSVISVVGYDDNCSGEYHFRVGYYDDRSTIATHYFSTTAKWGEAVDIIFSKLGRRTYNVSLNGETKNISAYEKLKQVELESDTPLELLSLGNQN
ncbi:hypothetical protein [Teredinibacter turnerae]|uniref:hypothetical protein n=1 Tax=Teredinibacter turnerae TaxID=2426 RepID=UPI0004773730|nr:hypothetical protein [Teredinibacter turnerae]